MKDEKQPSRTQAMLIMGLVIAVILITLSFSMELVTALLFGAITASFGAVYLGYRWENIEKGIIGGISNAWEPF